MGAGAKMGLDMGWITVFFIRLYWIFRNTIKFQNQSCIHQYMKWMLQIGKANKHNGIVKHINKHTVDKNKHTLGIGMSYLVMLVKLGPMYLRYVCTTTHGRCHWKLETTTVDTVTPVISTCCQVPCWVAGLMHCEYKRSAAQHGHHSENSLW